MQVCHGKKSLPLETGDRLVRVLFCTHLGYDSRQFCPMAPALPARRVSRDLMPSREIRRPRQACSIMKQLKRQVLGWAPGNHLGSLLELSTVLLLVRGPLLQKHSILLLGPAVDDSLCRALYVHYSRKTAQLFSNYALCFCGLIIPEIMPA